MQSKLIKLPSYLDFEFHIVPVVKIQLLSSLLSLLDASPGLSQSKQKVCELTLSFFQNKTRQLNPFLEKGEKYFSNFLLFMSHYLLKTFYLTVIQFHHFYLQISFLKHRSVGINHSRS